MAKDGALIAFCDCRYAGLDVGWNYNNLRNDIEYRVKPAGSETWSPASKCLIGTGNRGDGYMCAFGDAAVVTDNETGKILILSVAGSARYSEANRTDNIMRCVRTVYNYANGVLSQETQTEVTDQLYSFYTDINAMFIGSGRLCQSKIIKVGSYYRVYAALCCFNNGAKGNRVIFSDDLGETWNDLCTINASPTDNYGDEPKIEELPDGRVLLSSRLTSANTGRVFNIFTYSDINKGEGTWDTHALSTSLAASSRQTNGEIMIVPAVNTSNNKKVFIALHTVPTGNARENVTVFYRELDPSIEGDMDTPEQIANDWKEGYQISHTTSAYSTMCLDAEYNIIFFYEENVKPGQVFHGNSTTPSNWGDIGYDMQVCTLSLEEITGNNYKYRTIE